MNLLKKILVSVAKGEISTHHPENKKIGYKELWIEYKGTYPRNFGNYHARIVASWIVPLAEHEINAGRPPLNTLVVNKKTGIPGEDISKWNKHFKSKCKSFTGYASFREAQESCWSYYRKNK